MATNNEELSNKIADYADELKDMVEEKAQKLESIKYASYLQQM